MNTLPKQFKRDLCVYADTEIRDSLSKINLNQLGMVIVLESSDQVVGILTDGDIRRGLIQDGETFLSKDAGEVVQREFVFGSDRDSLATLDSKLSQRIKLIPVLDAHGHLKRIHTRSASSIFLPSRIIADEQPCFVIAEIGNNHNGDIDAAKRLIDAAKYAGADAVKFQHRVFTEAYRRAEKCSSSGARVEAEDLGAEYVIDLIKKFSLSICDLKAAFDYARELDLLPFCTPWDLESLRELEEIGDLDLYKIASADLTNHELLKAVARTGKPMIVSTGMSSEHEIIAAVNCLEAEGAQFAMLHCNSTYPTPMKDINLAYMCRLKDLCGGRIVGYSGHERGFLIPIASVSLGARIVEKHLTLDRSLEGNDHRVSLLPKEFKQMIEGIRTVEEAMGGAEKRIISQGELMNRESLAKSLVAVCDVSKGCIITRDMVMVRSPGRGLQPHLIDELIGKKAVRDILSGDFFYKSDILEKSRETQSFTFSRQWGLPVRFHDFNDMLNLSPDIKLVEFHLSYRDLDFEVDRFEPIRSDVEVIVHAPELFNNDHLLDLASPSDTYRQKSIENLELLIKFCHKLLAKLGKASPIKIVLNVGGFSLADFDLPDMRAQKYDLLEQSLNSVDLAGVTLLPQTMPPFPWHFGGQSHHNLFVRPNEIVRFCEKNGLKICMDLSHSALACNYFGIPLPEFVASVGHLVDHMHISDAKGVDGEGLPIGSGDLDFYELAGAISKSVPANASWIPEVWQGHKNKGEGFLDALEKLSAYPNGF